MIKAGCASAHPEDGSFLLSGEAAELLRSRDFLIALLPVPPVDLSVDVLFVDANKVNKLTSVTDLRSWTWVLLSSNKADAWRAWQMGAVYFLLRPFTLHDLDQALQRIQQNYYWKKQTLPPDFQHRMLEVQMIKGRRVAVDSRDILFLEARGEITCLHLCLPGQEKLIATRNLGYWEQRLGEAEFIRTHKKYLVNAAHVSALNTNALRVHEHLVPVAKRRKKDVEKYILSHQTLLRQPVKPAGEGQGAPLVEKK